MRPSLREGLMASCWQVDPTFSLLGVKITPNIFVSLITALAASIASWVASLL